MDLRIRNDEAYRLARLLADATGESLTAAVTTALREKLQRLTDASSLSEELLTLGRDAASRMHEPWRIGDIDALLYDENGLPR